MCSEAQYLARVGHIDRGVSDGRFRDGICDMLFVYGLIDFYKLDLGRKLSCDPPEVSCTGVQNRRSCTARFLPEIKQILKKCLISFGVNCMISEFQHGRVCNLLPRPGS